MPVVLTVDPAPVFGLRQVYPDSEGANGEFHLPSTCNLAQHQRKTLAVLVPYENRGQRLPIELTQSSICYRLAFIGFAACQSHCEALLTTVADPVADFH